MEDIPIEEHLALLCSLLSGPAAVVPGHSLVDQSSFLL